MKYQIEFVIVRVDIIQPFLRRNKMADEKKKPGYQIHKIYDGGKAKNQSCPKCGPGVFMADHKDRRTCGKCKYHEQYFD